MKLVKGNLVFEVDNPVQIAAFKQSGFEEYKEPAHVETNTEQPKRRGRPPKK